MPRAGMEPDAAVTAPDELYDNSLRDLLQPLLAVIAVLLLAATVASGAVLTGAERATMGGLAGGSALVLGAAALLVHRHDLTGLAHPVAFAALVLAAGNALGYFVVTDRPFATVAFVLVFLAAGTVLLSVRWLLALLYLGWGGWLAGALLVGRSDRWPEAGAALVVATALAIVVSLLRRSAVRGLAEARAALDAAAVRDGLTGVANRRGLAMVGAQLVENARRQGDAVHCIFVDVEGLGTVNHVLGQAAGDEVLVSVADALRQVTRATDVVARWGGDKFCVVGPGPGMPPLELERRVHDSLLPHAPVPAEVWGCRVSAGGAMLAPWDAGTLDTLLGKADQEMYLRRSLRKEAPRPARRTATTD